MAIRFDEDLSPLEWQAQDERDAVEDKLRAEAEARFREDAEQFLIRAATEDYSGIDVDPSGGGDLWGDGR